MGPLQSLVEKLVDEARKIFKPHAKKLFCSFLEGEPPKEESIVDSAMDEFVSQP